MKASEVSVATLRVDFYTNDGLTKPVIDGMIDYRGVRTDDPEILQSLGEIIKQVYTRAYRQGVRDQQASIRRELGI